MFNKVLPILFISLASCVSAYADTTMADADTSLQADMSYAAPAEVEAVDTAETGMVLNPDGTYSVAEAASPDTPTDAVVDNGAIDTANYYTDANATAVEPATDANTGAMLAADNYMTTDASYTETPNATQGAFTVDANGNVQAFAAEQDAAEVLDNQETVAATAVETNNL
jgi:hypothetical protein